MKHKNQPRVPVTGTSRRRFTKAVAAAFVAAPLVGSRASSDEQQQTPTHAHAAKRETPAPSNQPTATPTPTPAAASSTPPKPSPAAEAYAEVLRARFGTQLSQEDLTRITSDLDGYLRTSERLRAFKLKNADEPDFVFRA